MIIKKINKRSAGDAKPEETAVLLDAGKSSGFEIKDSEEIPCFDLNRGIEQIPNGIRSYELYQNSVMLFWLGKGTVYTEFACIE